METDSVQMGKCMSKSLSRIERLVSLVREFYYENFALEMCYAAADRQHGLCNGTSYQRNWFYYVTDRGWKCSGARQWSVGSLRLRYFLGAEYSAVLGDIAKRHMALMRDGGKERECGFFDFL
ncbi:MAG: hypothetical protein LKK60_10195 [Bifidobacterium tibiigranuli]|jgi:hypothetical protein|uniref:hypothetical protein n=1 Tax=Bifidobacterium tibiigranuli TaxID=2172043 RepID=UPI0026EF37D2|nr:hypothetical protein [Bifidobacterium tibiigranuli]MCI2186583.1 hypothetical protein [Bifidobacterium tibiigranuli]